MKNTLLVFASALSISLAIPLAHPIAAKEKKSSSDSPYRKEINEMVYNFQGCKRSESTVACSILVTNKKQATRKNYIGGGSFVSPGGKTYSHYSRDFSGDGYSVEMSQGIDYNAQLIFRDVPEAIKKVQILKVNFAPSNGKSYTLEFRNVKISEQE
jgi:hypothetical protein